MDSRRDFLKKAALLSGGLGMSSVFPSSIQKALAINPEEGSTFKDAEHIVLLMQENRSFDHCFGSLKGVRGFNDPRAIDLPNKIPVWFQTNKKGETYAPFRLNIKDTKATWIGDLPHSWENQLDARNEGKYDKWLDAKQTHRKQYQHIPATMGYYNRADIPFYYSFADAFTVFDQHFCSSLTGTTTNRHFFWTGTNRETPTAFPIVRNSESYYNNEVSWKTFPERLEENNISWRIYQNEISMQTELTGEDYSLLSNFTDNNLEWFSQFNVRYNEGHQKFLKKRFSELPNEIKTLENKLKNQPKQQAQKIKNELEKKKNQYQKIVQELEIWNPDNFKKLNEYQQNLHKKAFTTNSKDPFYHETETITYKDGDTERVLKIPKGDILHQFREDVDSGKLPTVSWLVAPQKFSDHPSAPWYGAWYVSEVLDILTKNPEVWKKTIFILTYDENDGYFDHVPPFVAPHPKQKNKASKGIDTTADFVSIEQELQKQGMNPKNARESAIGLGYRVPMVIASPWTKGGWVNSEVCDLTSTLQFMEIFLKNKTGKSIIENNISSWRRAMTSNLTSAFRPYNTTKFNAVDFIDKNKFMQKIYNAKFKELPKNFNSLSENELAQIKNDEYRKSLLPEQEKGIKNSCALPYELYVNDLLDIENNCIKIAFNAANQLFKNNAAGAPFNVYAPDNYFQKQKNNNTKKFLPVKTWSYAVEAGETVVDQWNLDNFENKNYYLRTYGPNGFYREIKGNALDPIITIKCMYEKSGRFVSRFSGNIEIEIHNVSTKKYQLYIKDHAYGNSTKKLIIDPNKTINHIIDLKHSFGWYDFSIMINGYHEFERRYAGRVETGKHSKSDPYMGRVNI